MRREAHCCDGGRARVEEPPPPPRLSHGRRPRIDRLAVANLGEEDEGAHAKRVGLADLLEHVRERVALRAGHRRDVHDLIDVVLGVDYFDVRDSLEGRCGKTIFTGPIDRYFRDANLGDLEYRSINFEADLVHNSGYFQTKSVVNYPGPEVDFTRIVEYKHYFQQKSDYTITVKEYSTDEGDTYYPVPNPKNHELYDKYQELAKKEEKEKSVYFVGRLASYKYFNMDAAIDNALDVFNEIEGHPRQDAIEIEVVDEKCKPSVVSDSIH